MTPFDIDMLKERWPTSVLTPKQDAIGIALDDAELAAIGRLRFELFIERDGKKYPQDTRSDRMFLEPIDRVSLNFRVLRKKQCVAAIRLTRAVDALEDPQLRRLIVNSNLSPVSLPTSVVDSRMVVREETAARLVVPDLFREIYRTGFIAGAARCLVGARPELVPLFERFGFLAASRPYDDPVAGKMVPLVLDALDRDHLASIGSPLVRSHDELAKSLSFALQLEPA